MSTESMRIVSEQAEQDHRAVERQEARVQHHTDLEERCIDLEACLTGDTVETDAILADYGCGMEGLLRNTLRLEVLLRRLEASVCAASPIGCLAAPVCEGECVRVETAEECVALDEREQKRGSGIELRARLTVVGGTG